MNIAVCDDRIEATDLLYQMIKTYFEKNDLPYYFNPVFFNKEVFSNTNNFKTN